MKIIYNDRVIIPASNLLPCNKCVFGSSGLICKAEYFTGDLRSVVFYNHPHYCLGFEYESDI